MSHLHICPVCRAGPRTSIEGDFGKVSYGEVVGGGSTLMGVMSMWREDGFHVHDPNTHSIVFKCPEGHEWRETTGQLCPTCGTMNGRAAYRRITIIKGYDDE